MLPASKKSVWTTLGVALLCHTLLISFHASQRVDTSFVRVWFLDSLTPVAKLVDMTLYATGHVWSRYVALIGIYDENQTLRAENDGLRMRLAEQQEEILEARRLRRLLSLDGSGIGLRVVARVVSRDPVRGHQTVTIDKGRLHGLHPDSAVLTPAGIVGRVIYAANLSSVVQLIGDSQSAVGVMVRTTRHQGVVRGTGGSELELEFIEDDFDLQVGDEFITSGLDRIYPKGLPVGVITWIGPRSGLFKTVRIQPSADFGRLEEVVCVIGPPAGHEMLEF